MSFYRSIKDTTIQVKAVKNDGSKSAFSNLKSLISVTGENNLVTIERGLIFAQTRKGKFVVPRGYYLVKDSTSDVFVSSSEDFTSNYELGTAVTTSASTDDSGGDDPGAFGTMAYEDADDYYTKTEEDTWRNGVSQTDMGFLSGVTGDIQNQIDGKDNYQKWVVGDSAAATEDINSTNQLDITGASENNYLGISTALSGGDLKIRLDLNGLDVAAAVDGASDYVLLYDDSASKNTKATLDNIIAGTGAVLESDFTLNNSFMRKNNSGTVENIQIVDNTLVGRISGSELTGQTAGQVQTFLGLGTMAYEATTSYYTKTNLQTSGQASVHWDNITNEPSFLSQVDVTAEGGSTIELTSGSYSFAIQGASAGRYDGITTENGPGLVELRLDISNLATAPAVAGASDYVFMYDTSGTANTKVTVDNLIAGSGAVLESDFNLNNTLLYKNSSGTITVAQINEQTIVGRLTGGEITGLTGGQVQTLIDSPAISGTPSNNQLAVWTGSSTLEGESKLTFNGTTLTVNAITDLQSVLYCDTFRSDGGNCSIFSSDEADTRMTFNVASGSVACIYYYDTGDTTYQDFRFGHAAANVGIYWDNSASRVGINDDTPSYTLDVNGTLRSTGVLYSDGEIYALSTKKVYNEGDVAWIGDEDDSTPAWDFDESHNLHWNPSSVATATLSISNMEDGDSGIMLIEATGSNGTLTLPSISYPSSIAYTTSAAVICTVVKFGSVYIWGTRTTGLTPS